MGLDVAFDKEVAIKAGMQFKMEPRETDAAELARFKQRAQESVIEFGPCTQKLCICDQCSLNHWMQEVEYMVVPTTGHLVENNGFDDTVIVRANRWGNTHAPLTEWLYANGIQWDEY